VRPPTGSLAPTRSGSPPARLCRSTPVGSIDSLAPARFALWTSRLSRTIPSARFGFLRPIHRGCSVSLISNRKSALGALWIANDLSSEDDRHLGKLSRNSCTIFQVCSRCSSQGMCPQLLINFRTEFLISRCASQMFASPTRSWRP
jgi:hypothetical protein